MGVTVLRLEDDTIAIYDNGGKVFTKRGPTIVEVLSIINRLTGGVVRVKDVNKDDQTQLDRELLITLPQSLPKQYS